MAFSASGEKARAKGKIRHVPKKLGSGFVGGEPNVAAVFAGDK